MKRAIIFAIILMLLVTIAGCGGVENPPRGDDPDLDKSSHNSEQDSENSSRSAVQGAANSQDTNSSDENSACRDQNSENTQDTDSQNERSANKNQGSKNSQDIGSQNENAASCTANGFELNLFSDKAVYKSTDKIQLWATLKYTGDGDTITIWHGDPYIVFSITDGKDFDSGGMLHPVLISTVLDKGKLYRFDYEKSGGYDANDPDASFWKDFYKEKDLLLPEGEYTISARGEFSLTEDVVGSESGLLGELKIKVEAG